MITVVPWFGHSFPAFSWSTLPLPSLYFYFRVSGKQTKVLSFYLEETLSPLNSNLISPAPDRLVGAWRELASPRPIYPDCPSPRVGPGQFLRSSLLVSVGQNNESVPGGRSTLLLCMEYVLLSLGPQEKGLWDPQNSPLHKVESSVNAVTSMPSNIS